MKSKGLEVQQLLELLRVGLWGKQIDRSLFDQAVDWKNIYSLSKTQTVIGVVEDGINSLPRELMPGREVLLQFHSFVVRNAQYHSILNRALGDLIDRISLCGRRPILLKGQGVAHCYREPEKRQCGDIDLYIGKEHFNAASELIRTWVDSQGRQMVSGIKVGRKDISFNFRDVAVELHHTALVRDDARSEQKVQDWSYEMLHKERLEKLNIEGIIVDLPPVNFDALYIFYHMWYHFIGGGVGLRQLCDWARYLYTHRDTIDHNRLERDLKIFKMLGVWQDFGVLIVEHMGLPVEYFPLYSKRPNIRQAQRILDVVIREGNFGLHDPVMLRKPKGYTAGKLWRIFYISKRNLRLLRIFPAKTIISYPYFLFNGIVGFLKKR